MREHARKMSKDFARMQGRLEAGKGTSFDAPAKC